MQVNPPVLLDTGLPPGSSYTFGPSALAPTPSATSALAPVVARWAAFPEASYPITIRAAAVVGETLELSCGFGASPRWSLVRAPEKRKDMSKGEVVATLVDGRFTPRLPGLFVLQLDIGGGYIRQIELAAVTSDTLAVLQLSDASAARRRLRGIVNDLGVTAASVIDALESHPFEGGVTFARLLGNAKTTFAAQNFGA